MFDATLPNPSDLARRAALRQLCPSESGPPPRAFRVRAWRWHHLGVVRDLSRVEAGLRAQRGRLCGAGGGATRQGVVDALRYVVHDNWRLHDTVEARLLVPWLRAAAPGADPAFRRAARLVAAERSAVRAEADAALRVAERWVGAEGRACERGVDVVGERVRRLRENAGLLFRAAEQAFIPRVVEAFSEKEQLRFNSKVLKNISGKQARISLVIFDDAVRQDEPIVATMRDRREFESDIPGPIRRLAMPHWRRKFVNDKTRFLAGSDTSSP